MPTYQYKCECGHAFEEWQTISEEPVKVCPKCKEEKVKRLLGTGSGLLFKGQGWHQSDYGGKKGAR